MSEIEKSRVKRRPRIVAIQKKLLVQLIENYFIRATGKCSNVNFDYINTSAFDRFAEILNKWGPSKTSNEWKSSFYYMKNRIRRSVEMIIQSNASVMDNLSGLDLKLYSMSPSWFHGALEAGTSGIELNYDFGCYAEEKVPHSDFVKEDTNVTDFNDDLDHPAEYHANTEAVEEDTNGSNFNNFGCYTEEPLHTDAAEVDSENYESQYNSRRVLVAKSAEELEKYMSSPVILSDDEEFLELSSPSTCTNIPSKNCNVVAFEDCPSESIKSVAGPSSFSTNNQRAPFFRTQMPKLSTKIVKSNPAAKVGSKISELQKERLIQLIQNNFMRAFGRFVGAGGAHIKAQFWDATAKELNTLGPPRTGKQWKTIFNNIKTSAKSKLADDHNNVSGLITKPLTRLEEKVLSIYGMNALDGTQDLGEAGFRYKKTVPMARRVCESTVTSGALATLSSKPENQETTIEGSAHPDPEIEISNNDNIIISEDSQAEAASPDCSDSDLRELINEIWMEPITNETSTTIASKSTAADEVSRNQLEIRDRKSNSFATRSENHYNFEGDYPSSSRLRGHLVYHSRGSSHGHKLVEMGNSLSSQFPENYAHRSRGSSYSHNSGRGSRLPQNVSDYSNRSRGTSKRNTNEENADRTVAREDRDRSNLRHTVAVAPRVYESTVTSGALSNLLWNRINQDTAVEASNDPDIEITNSDNIEPASPGCRDDTVLNDLINEIWNEPIANESLETQENVSTAAGVVSIRNQSEIRDREPNSYASHSESHNNSSSSRLRGHSSYHSRGSSLGHNSKATKSVGMGSSSTSQIRGNSAHRSRGSTHAHNSGRGSRLPQNGSDYSNRYRGTSNGVRGVPRLHVRRRRRSSSEQIEEITNINQLFNDEDSDEENGRNSRNEPSRRNTISRNTNAENADRTVARVDRDRSNLRHRFTSFEMVQQSMDSQERFIEDNNRNHAELMFATDRNHLEMIGIFNATLR